MNSISLAEKLFRAPSYASTTKWPVSAPET
jgi:hypothetical protein